MIVLKSFICLAIICICAYLGFEKANSYQERKENLQKIKNGFNFFKSKIEFTYEPIKDILNEISGAVYFGEENIFSKTAIYLNNIDVSSAWRKAVQEDKKLNSEDKEILIQFGKLLGKTDKKGQISEIELALNFTNVQIEKAETSQKKNDKLYKSLGIILGLGLVIILW